MNKYYKPLFVFFLSLPGVFLGKFLISAPNAVNYIVAIFSILAGSLFAVISILGNPSMLKTGNNRVAWETAKDLHVRIQKHNALFVLYLIALLSIVLGEVFLKNDLPYKDIVFSITGFLCLFAFFMSITVPYSLAAFQAQRMQDRIDEIENED